ncbi:MAG TPA: ABC transporter permease [Blastocatellia bacterium]|jgi:sodium transport system permease protein|nr:ABC transporter permease [Blastocatellia bacterium]
MQLQSIKLIYLKEMLDLLRDRRTIISMLVFPMVVLPLIFLGLNRFFFRSINRAQDKQFNIALKQETGLEGITRSLEQAGFKIRPSDDPRRAVENKETELGMDVSGESNSPAIRIFADQSQLEVKVAGGRIETALNRLKEAKIKNDLERAGMPERILTPFTVENVNTAPPQKMSGMFVATIIGYMFVTFIFMGAMYPAIDMTAGEKERRTMEMLLSSPASRSEIVLGKISVAITASFLTSVLTIISLGISFFFGMKGVRSGQRPQLIMELPLDSKTFLLIFVSIIPMAVLSATLMIAVATTAKSYKEAQSYVTPLLMIAILPALVSILPGVKLNAGMALIPIVNFSQLIKELILGDWSWTGFMLTLLSNLIYAAIAFTAAVRVFKNERILFRT